MSDIVEVHAGKELPLPPLLHSNPPTLEQSVPASEVPSNLLPVPAMGRSTSPAGRKFDDIDHRLLDPHGTVNAPVVMPGIDGVPFRGRIPHLKETDPRSKRPTDASKVHIEILDLSNPDHMERYRQICQVIMNGFGVMGEELKQEDKEKLSWRVFIRWYEQYVTMPKL